jgi:hypothetical protein
MHSAAVLRRELSGRGQQIAAATGAVHELTPGEMPTVIFGQNETRRHGISIPPPIGISAQIRIGRGDCARSIYRVAPGIAPRGLAMQKARLCEQFGRTAHQYLLLPAQGSESRLVLRTDQGVPQVSAKIPGGKIRHSR